MARYLEDAVDDDPGYWYNPTGQAFSPFSVRQRNGKESNAPGIGDPCNNGAGYINIHGECVPAYTPERIREEEAAKTSGVGAAADTGAPPPSFGVNYNIPDAPAFSAPKFAYQGRPIPEFNPQAKFEPPLPSEINTDPSYRFRFDEGQRALRQKAAGLGRYRSGATEKGLMQYGSDLASQEYGNIYARARDTYDAKYGQEKDVYGARLGEYGLDFGGYQTGFDRNYTGARDEYAPKFATWQTRAAAEMRAKDLANANAWAHWFDQNVSPFEFGQLFPDRD